MKRCSREPLEITEDLDGNTLFAAYELRCTRPAEFHKEHMTHAMATRADGSSVCINMSWIDV